MSFHAPKLRYRITHGPMASSPLAGNNGAFTIPSSEAPRNIALHIIASDGDGGVSETPWEHVSVSTTKRCPYWDEMCFVKELFWDDTDVVAQYHPAKEDYINDHPFCLHMWRPVGLIFPTPPALMVGYNKKG